MYLLWVYCNNSSGVLLTNGLLETQFLGDLWRSILHGFPGSSPHFEYCEGPGIGIRLVYFCLIFMYTHSDLIQDMTTS